LLLFPESSSWARVGLRVTPLLKRPMTSDSKRFPAGVALKDAPFPPRGEKDSMKTSSRESRFAEKSSPARRRVVQADGRDGIRAATSDFWASARSNVCEFSHRLDDRAFGAGRSRRVLHPAASVRGYAARRS